MVVSDDIIKIDGEYYPLSITVSGINKFKFIPYLYKEMSKNDILKSLELFDDELTVPPENSGKMISTYIDITKSGIVVDYNGTPLEYEEYSSIHLEPSEYNLSLSAMYVNYLKGIRIL
jgi:hypothetical protein